MKTFGSIFILFISFLCNANAQEVTVNTQLANEARLSEYKTFSWVGNENMGQADMQRQQGQMDRKSEMTQKDHANMGKKDHAKMGDKDHANMGHKDHAKMGDKDRAKRDKDAQADRTDINIGDDASADMAGDVDDEYNTAGENIAETYIADEEAIKKAVKYEMESRGYKYVENGGDILIDTKVLHGEAEIENFQSSNYGSAWGPTIGVDAGSGTTSGAIGGTTGGAMNEQALILEDGTIVVNFVDKEEGEVVWQAFATGIIKGEDSTLENIEEEVVSQIFDEYTGSANN